MTEFGSIRAWDGSQHRAFEELCYQLRDPTPAKADLIKTGDPDGGLEWYVRHHSNGVEWGWQAKYSTDIETVLKLMERSLKTVILRRPNCRRLTFCIPFDLPDAPDPGKRKSARQKFEDRKTSWRERIDGAARVRIDLWQAGDLTERLANHPSQRGKTWFFWHEEVFSPEWCRRRLNITIRAADERYSPKLHVELPVTFALEGVVGSRTFWARYSERRHSVLAAATRLSEGSYSGLGVTQQLIDLRRAATAWRDGTPQPLAMPDRLDRQPLVDLTAALRVACVAAHPPNAGLRHQRDTAKHRRNELRRRSLAAELGKLERAAHQFESFLDAPAAAAAERGALLLTGDAGQGKTHLLCDFAEREVDGGRPATVSLANRFSGRQVWNDLAHDLGLGSAGSAVLLDAMRAAGEAAGAPFVLVIDALNEAADARGWQAELPALLAETKEDPWIAVAVSVRTPFLPIVLPSGGLGDAVAQVEHPGFRGREVEATEQFFDVFGLEAPKVPLLTPEFTNPLFLKLYCEGLQASGIQDPGAGSAHIGDVFERYLAWKAERIYDRLAVDPTSNPVAAAITAFAEALGAADQERLPYEKGGQLINGFAPGLNQWPNTLFGQLLGEGVLAKDAAWDPASRDYIDVVRFSYQRFADHRVAVALLASFPDAAALMASVAAGEPLRQRIQDAPAGWIEALAQQVPERFGIELYDAARWTLDEFGVQVWDRALARSIVARRPEAVSDRSLELLLRANERNWGETDYVLDAALTVAPIPEHPMNARWLHQRLLGIAMPDRDVAWSIPTFFMLDERGPLDRLIRWAARGPGVTPPEEVVELTALTLAWTLSSPNRYLRDYTTKALVTLLRGRLDLAARLLANFRAVDDPYIIERLAVVTHGVLLTTERSDPGSAAGLARTLRDIALAHTPNIVTRDAVRGAFECCLRREHIAMEEYQEVVPPYGSSPPGEPRSKEELEKAYDRDKRDPTTGERIPSPYGMLFVSLFDLGDFGRYVVESKLRHFTRHRLSDPIPEPGPSEPEPASLSPDELAALLAVYEGKVRATSDEQAASPDPDQPPPPEIAPREPLSGRRTPRADTYPTDQAQCWIFERVIELGWTPERFSGFERTYLGSAGRSSHKPERFGKKYQWIALRELIARIADNFHAAMGYHGDSSPYAGPWQFFGRDIDPTLPPPQRIRDDHDEFQLGPTFLDGPAWWTPPVPHYEPHDPPPPPNWAVDPHDIPDFKELVRHRDSDGHHWLTLCAFYRWGDAYDDDDARAADRRDLWSHIFGWLVKPADFSAVRDYLGRHSLMGRWMPEGATITDAAHLGEMPWASAAREHDAEEWPEIWHRGEDDNAQLDRQVSPAWIDYYWEGNVWDCSIDDGVAASMPAPLLFTAGKLTWHSGTRTWVDATGAVVAQTARAGAHSALLVREDWITRLLDQLKLRLIIGWLGEKQLMARGLSTGLVGDSLEIDGTAWLSSSGLTCGQRRLTRRQRS